MEIVLIAAVAENRVIGREGNLVFVLPGDLPRFKAMTIGRPVIMGRKTWDSLPLKPLPGRRNIVLTRQSGWTAEEADTFESVTDVLAAVAGEAEVSVIGGAEIYRLFLPHATRMELTEVHASPVGDAEFPVYSGQEWEEVRRENVPGNPSFDYVTYRRR